jgi:hypothetical protein
LDSRRLPNRISREAKADIITFSAPATDGALALPYTDRSRGIRGSLNEISDADEALNEPKLEPHPARATARSANTFSNAKGGRDPQIAEKLY